MVGFAKASLGQRTGGAKTITWSVVDGHGESSQTSVAKYLTLDSLQSIVIIGHIKDAHLHCIPNVEVPTCSCARPYRI